MPVLSPLSHTSQGSLTILFKKYSAVRGELWGPHFVSFVQLRLVWASTPHRWDRCAHTCTPTPQNLRLGSLSGTDSYFWLAFQLTSLLASGFWSVLGRNYFLSQAWDGSGTFERASRALKKPPSLFPSCLLGFLPLSCGTSTDLYCMSPRSATRGVSHNL